MDTCGTLEEPNEMYANSTGYSKDHICPIHHIVGEEFFGSIPTAMFTVYRCMIGDCTSAGGHSIVVHLSKGYGFTFYITYCVAMIVAICGLFNIVTALFVESTLTGLKGNDVHQRNVRMQENK